MYLLEHEKADVTPRMLYELQVWKDQGRRAVNIELDLEKATIWVYDYELQQGKYVVDMQDLPDRKELLRMVQKEENARRKRLEKQLTSMGG